MLLEDKAQTFVFCVILGPAREGKKSSVKAARSIRILPLL